MITRTARQSHYTCQVLDRVDGTIFARSRPSSSIFPDEPVTWSSPGQALSAALRLIAWDRQHGWSELGNKPSNYLITIGHIPPGELIDDDHTTPFSQVEIKDVEGGL